MNCTMPEAMLNHELGHCMMQHEQYEYAPPPPDEHTNLNIEFIIVVILAAFIAYRLVHRSAN